MRCGTDIVQICRMDDLVRRHERSLGRFFTERELAYCQKGTSWRTESLAGIFAAKEALFKALGTGFRQGKWTDVEVVHDELGAPRYCLYGFYAEAVQEKGCQPPSLSIAHDGDYAVAFVVL
ncbi:holo-ACP synthase [Megasphaera sp.]|uniref:holo-ACP synthase n=1 Tax=Megasphaera sp. TaxID=2023260 RepID=UPI001D6DCA13|nr:holo-ACP synthase [Megasphaera sp.]MBS6103753.1 holo-ACP synthase [Megasphaera sp.]